jgi:hypothetical protein
MILTRFRIGSVAKVFAAVHAGMGLIFGLCFAAVSMLGSGPATALGDGFRMPSLMGALFGVGAVISLPILYGAFGLIGGAITAALYNMVARVVGGIQIETRIIDSAWTGQRHFTTAEAEEEG